MVAMEHNNANVADLVPAVCSARREMGSSDSDIYLAEPETTSFDFGP